MDVAFLFSFSFLASILAIHLESYDVSDLFVAMCFMFESLIYLISSLVVGYIFKNTDERYLMTFGVILIGFGYLILGVCKYYFPDFVVLIFPALPLLAIGKSLTFSNL